MEDEESKILALKNLLTSGSIIIPSSDILQKQKVEESLLVVDICESTALANQYGENALLKAVYVLGEVLTRHSETNETQFLKCMGDGFFATFQETRQALCVACSLLQDIERITTKKPELPPFSSRLVIHRGLVSTDQTGGRLGLACHLVFRMEQANLESAFREDELRRDLCKRNPLFLTDEAILSLEKDLHNCFGCLGEFTFEGFDSPVRVNVLVEDRKIFLERIR